MSSKSPVRKYVESQALSAQRLRPSALAGGEPEIKLYNYLCAELDRENPKLADEHEGSIAVTWQKIE